MTETVIQLLSTIGRSYQVPFEVLAYSVVISKQPETAIEWHIVVEAIDTGWQDWLHHLNQRYQRNKTTFQLHKLQGLESARLPLRGRAQKIMYARLAAPEQLQKHARKLLYLDADLLVLGQIESLWETDLEGHLCACCQDLAVPTISSPMALQKPEILNLPSTTPYFNAGVMLIDTQAWQQRGVCRAALTYLENQAEQINLYDQEALNAAIGGDWLRISYRWNLIASLAGRSFARQTVSDWEDYQSSLNQPCLIHYAGTLKPWRNQLLRGRWYEIYRSMLGQALPQHRTQPTLPDGLQASYDRLIRPWAYGVERKLWRILRGF